MRELLPDLPTENIRGRTGEARHGGGRGARRGLGRRAAIIRATMIVLPADHVINDHGRISKNVDDGGAALRKRRARWSQLASNQPGPARDLATSSKAQPCAFERRLHAERRFIGSFAFAKNRTPIWPKLRPEGKFPLERRDVCLVGADSAERIQSPCAGAGEFHFASPRDRKLRENALSESVRQVADDLL